MRTKLRPWNTIINYNSAIYYYGINIDSSLFTELYVMPAHIICRSLTQIRFHFKCYSKMNFALCQLLRWSFLFIYYLFTIFLFIHYVLQYSCLSTYYNIIVYLPITVFLFIYLLQYYCLFTYYNILVYLPITIFLISTYYNILLYLPITIFLFIYLLQ